MNALCRLTLLASFLFSGNLYAATYDIIMKNREFSQTEIMINRGDSIRFLNAEENTEHNLFSLSKVYPFEISQQLPGIDVTIPFRKGGSFEVECAIHPTMHLRVMVK
ncbi:MAG: methylamine utilization protein [Zetaproteobacteria bacterium]|nr:methylamine utilization protein [Zetaproteobacteria bacterium]